MLVKVLTHSDCSYFEEYFRRNSTSRQKAINLDQAKMRALFPALAGAANSTAFQVEVSVFAHGSAPVLDQQAISLSQKNWRLNGLLAGGLVANPGDIIVCQMLGDDAAEADRIPTGIAMALIRRGEHGHQWMLERCAPHGFAFLHDELILEAGEAGEWPTDSPVWQLVDFLTRGLAELVEDVVAIDERGWVALVGLRSVERTGTTREAIDKLQQVRTAIGLGGETLVDAVLEALKNGRVIDSYQWVSLSRATAPIDFVLEDGRVDVGIEVKTTKGDHDTPFFISLGELRAAANMNAYEIWRVSGLRYDLWELSGSIRRTDPSLLVGQTLDWLRTSPLGVSVPTVSVDPHALNWEEEQWASCPTSRIPDEDWFQKINLAAS